MKPPIRLLEGTDLSAAERALLEAGRAVAPAHYDVAAGAAKFQAALQGVASAAPAATTTALAKTAALTKLAVVLVPTLGVVAAYYAMRSRPQPTDRTRAPVVEEQASETVAPPIGAPSVDVAPHAAATHVETPAPLDTFKPERTRSVRRTTHAPPVRTTITTHASDSVTPASSGATATMEPASATEPEPREEVAAVEEPAPAPREAPAEVPDSINELRGIAAARALIERDPAGALAILRRLARVHPHGYFVEERAALMVLALAGSDDDVAARKQATKFLKTYPASPFADRVRNAVR